MPSILTGFEYDIFISYRQNDNRSGWVTDFVKHLNEELAATFKEPVSVYFDANPTDGLLETHDVDDSLKGKLKCMVFIPILSQTYCDTKSFAWRAEFLAFKKVASEDTLGLKVKLTNGNVASRILPVCIHELDATDKQLAESELGGVLRGIDFIYKSQGVVRPLKPSEEDARANLNHTFYRDQINKVARAIKELIDGIQQSIHSGTPVSITSSRASISPSARKKIAFVSALLVFMSLAAYGLYYFGGFKNKFGKEVDKSIAVLPFENMNNDPDQDYFSNGITEDILNHLTKVSDLKVKSRTSTLQYKGTKKPITEIGEELSVGNIVEGSVRRVGDRVRIVVQLIDVETDLHLWSETYDRDLKDVLAVQSEIAIEIANALQARLTAVEKQNIQKDVSLNVTAYDYFLRSRDVLNSTNEGKRDIDDALLLVNQAIQLDSNFSEAYSLKSLLWFYRSTFGVNQKVWHDSAMHYSNKAIAKDPASPDGHILQGQVNQYLGLIAESQQSFKRAYELAPNDPDVMRQYGYQLLRGGDEKGADLVLKSIEDEYSFKDPEYYLALTSIYNNVGDRATSESLLKKSRGLNPGAIRPHVMLSQLYFNAGDRAKTLLELNEAEGINPEHTGVIDLKAWHYYMSNDLEKAAAYWSRYKAIEATFEDSTQTVPYRTRLAMVYVKMGKKKEADALVKEDLKIREELLTGKRSMGSWANLGSVYYDMAVDHSYLGNEARAVQCLDSVVYYRFRYSWGFHNDPLFANLRDRTDFKGVLKKVDDFDAFLRKSYSNALNRQEASQELKKVLK